MSTARLFLPDQPVQHLTGAGASSRKPLAIFPIRNGQPDPTREPIADPAGVAEALGIPAEDVALVHSDCSTLVYAHRHASSADGRDNPAAELAVYGACGEQSEMVGPVLLLTRE